jgi:hypothetical protein
MKKIALALIVSSSLISNAAMASDFFLAGGLGFAHTNYGSNSELSNFENVQEQNDSAHVPLAFSIAGLWQLGDNLTLLGAAINESTDLFPQNDNPAYDHASGSITQTQLAATIRHFFGPAAGTGFYLRADLGISSVNENTSVTVSRLNTSTNQQQVGLLLLGGAGYSIPIASNVGFQLEADYARTVLKRGGIGTFEPTIGVIVHL